MRIWIPMILYIAVQAITPGPNNLTCLYLGGTYGIRGVRKFLTASMLSLLVKTLLCGLLNIVLSEILPGIVQWLKWAGAAFMLYLAWNMIISGWKEERAAEVKSSASFRDGVILQLLNGKSWVASLSVFAVYVIPITAKLSAVVLVSLVFVLIMLTASLVWAIFGTMLKKVISEYRKPFGIVMGLSLVWCAISAVI